MPYISASIIMQLLSVVHPADDELKKEGEAGRRKISQYTRYLTLVLATFQAIGIATGLPNMIQGLVVNPTLCLLYSSGEFSNWNNVPYVVGEQITERGIGNGISILIFAGIVAGLPTALGQTAEQARQGDLNLLFLLLAVIVIALLTFVVFVERGQRRIVLTTQNVSKVRKVFAAQSTHLPLKINMAGVIPPIFASSIILFPGTFAGGLVKNEGNSRWLQ